MAALNTILVLGPFNGFQSELDGEREKVVGNPMCWALPCVFLIEKVWLREGKRAAYFLFPQGREHCADSVKARSLRGGGAPGLPSPGTLGGGWDFTEGGCCH